MKKFFLLLLVVCISCSTKSKIAKGQSDPIFQSVSIDTILKEKISIRAILTDKNRIWYAADQGKFGFCDLSGGQKFQSVIKKEDSNLEFRSIAQTPEFIFVLNVGNPALLYKISKKDLKVSLVYEEQHEKVFYDSMQFWNEREGIALGDPIQECLSIITTHDGGNSWQKLHCAALPKITDGEAAFAASNTNIVIKGNEVWLVSGGKQSRIFYSRDKAETWQVFETPIVQGQAMTGIFTADFYDSKTGFIAGGNYEQPDNNSQNKAITMDGGKNWELIAQNQAFGYTSCVQFVPESKGSELVSVGASGLYYSADAGKNWKKLLENKELYTIRFIDRYTAVAAGQNIMLKLNFK